MDEAYKKLKALYAWFGAGLVLSLIPLMLAATLSLFVLVGVLIGGYVMRAREEPKTDFLQSHATYVIRTIWIGSTLAALTIMAAAIYLLQVIDNTPLDPCIQYFMDSSGGAVDIDMMRIGPLFSGCLTGFMMHNIGPFIVAFFIAAGPVLLYFGVRYARGLIKLLARQPINKPGAWF